MKMVEILSMNGQSGSILIWYFYICICLGACGEAPKTKRRNWDNPSKDTSEWEDADWRDLRGGWGWWGGGGCKISQSGNGGLLEHMTSHVIILFFVTSCLSLSPATPFIRPFFTHPLILFTRKCSPNLSCPPQNLLSKDQPPPARLPSELLDMIRMFSTIISWGKGDRNFRAYGKMVHLH